MLLDQVGRHRIPLTKKRNLDNSIFGMTLFKAYQKAKIACIFPTQNRNKRNNSSAQGNNTVIYKNLKYFIMDTSEIKICRIKIGK